MQDFESSNKVILVVNLCSARRASSLRQLAIQRAPLILAHPPLEKHTLKVRRQFFGGV